MTAPSRATFPALGTTATLVVREPASLERALAVLRGELAAIDLAASRFREDSELTAVNAANGRPVAVSPVLRDAIEAAVRAARVTDGLVDPTVGEAMRIIGYDRDFAAVAAIGPAVRVRLRPVPGWEEIRVDRAASTVRVPSGVQLDLGATAKARCADLAALKIADAVGTGVLVSLGGDIAVAGPPPDGGWTVQVADDHGAPLEAGGPTVSIRSGGLATSSTTVRRWGRGGRAIHHIIDPSTGASAQEHWRTVTVAAGSCLDANVASCAAIVLGAAAPGWLEARALPARLVEPSGDVTTVAGWPTDARRAMVQC